MGELVDGKLQLGILFDFLLVVSSNDIGPEYETAPWEWDERTNSREKTWFWISWNKKVEPDQIENRTTLLAPARS